MSKAARIARALGSRPNGDGYLVRCPVAGHGKGKGDRSPSLSICVGDEQLLVKCWRTRGATRASFGHQRSAPTGTT
jgi:hypothetical protein